MTRNRKSEKMDERIKKLSKHIVENSIQVKKGDTVLISSVTLEPSILVRQLIRDIVKKEGIPFVKIIDPSISALLSELTDEKRIQKLKQLGQNDIDNYDAFISIRYTTNDYENSKTDPKMNKKLGEEMLEIDDVRINQRKWVLLNFPSKMDAYKAKMTSEDFYNYAFDVMTIDYQDLKERVLPLKELMEKTDSVRIKGPGTDLTFSIKGMKAIPCCGLSNIPDGEVYTAPVKNSVNGTITYNTPSPYQGYIFHQVKLTFEKGKIIEAVAQDNNEKLNEIFDTDEGARYVGEFSFGLNPKILHAMGDILFDEKIIGSIHFTPGRCYADADNGNQSAIHWDLVLNQREEYGGGEIYFDDILIRKDGKFVLPELKHLNYDLK